jgi:hypothetical protein
MAWIRATTFDDRAWEAKISRLVDSPTFRMRVSLLEAHVDWEQSYDMTPRTMIAIARVHNQLMEDATPKTPATPQP